MRKKDQKRFEKDALIHMDALYGAAVRFTGSQDRADDLLQETILRAYRFWHTFDGSSNCKAWLFRILTNTYYSHYQKSKRQRARNENAGMQQELTDGVLLDTFSRTQSTHGEKALSQKQLSSEITEALEGLRGEYRIPVVLCDLCGFSYKEISSILDCPIGTVMSRLYRGRKELQTTLRPLAVDQGILPPTSSTNTVNINDYR